MPIEAQQCIVTTHSTAIIRDPNLRLPAVPDGDVDSGRGRIERILDQFLHNRSRPLDDFARSDLVGERIGKNSNPPGHSLRFEK
jgi:hypothetical protein